MACWSYDHLGFVIVIMTDYSMSLDEIRKIKVQPLRVVRCVLDAANDTGEVLKWEPYIFRILTYPYPKRRWRLSGANSNEAGQRPDGLEGFRVKLRPKRED